LRLREAKEARRLGRLRRSGGPVGDVEGATAAVESGEWRLGLWVPY
jgi:hypothetical protein